VSWAHDICGIKGVGVLRLNTQVSVPYKLRKYLCVSRYYIGGVLRVFQYSFLVDLPYGQGAGYQKLNSHYRMFKVKPNIERNTHSGTPDIVAPRLRSEILVFKYTRVLALKCANFTLAGFTPIGGSTT
jgi:hypothetical protein